MKKFVCISLILLLALAMFCGCAAKAEDSNYYMTEAPMAEGFYGGGSYRDDMVEVETMPALDESNSTSVAANRKLIRTLSLSVETENYTDFLASIEREVSLCGGYIENMEASTRYSSSNRYANLTIRVPANQLDEFASQVGEISNVVYRSESNKDITTTYVDTQSRRDALKTEHDRLLELLEKAESLTDVLEIENRLTEVRYQLQSIESQLRTYDNLVDYATISLDVSEVKVYTEIEEKGFWEELGSDFIGSVKGVWNVIKGIFSFLVIAFPYLLLIGIMPLFVLLPIFISKKKRNARKQETKENQQ